MRPEPQKHQSPKRAKSTKPPPPRIPQAGSAHAFRHRREASPLKRPSCPQKEKPRTSAKVDGTDVKKPPGRGLSTQRRRLRHRHGSGPLPARPAVRIQPGRRRQQQVVQGSQQVSYKDFTNIIAHILESLKRRGTLGRPTIRPGTGVYRVGRPRPAESTIECIFHRSRRSSTTSAPAPRPPPKPKPPASARQSRASATAKAQTLGQGQAPRALGPAKHQAPA